MNEAETKYYVKANSNRILPASSRTSNIYKTQAQSDYERKKQAEHKAVHDEIRRVSLQQSII